MGMYIAQFNKIMVEHQCAARDGGWTDQMYLNLFISQIRDNRYESIIRDQRRNLWDLSRLQDELRQEQLRLIELHELNDNMGPRVQVRQLQTTQPRRENLQSKTNQGYG